MRMRIETLVHALLSEISRDRQFALLMQFQTSCFASYHAHVGLKPNAGPVQIGFLEVEDISRS